MQFPYSHGTMIRKTDASSNLSLCSNHSQKLTMWKNTFHSSSPMTTKSISREQAMYWRTPSCPCLSQEVKLPNRSKRLLLWYKCIGSVNIEKRTKTITIMMTRWRMGNWSLSQSNWSRIRVRRESLTVINRGEIRRFCTTTSGHLKTRIPKGNLGLLLLRKSQVKSWLSLFQILKNIVTNHKSHLLMASSLRVPMQQISRKIVTQMKSSQARSINSHLSDLKQEKGLWPYPLNRTKLTQDPQISSSRWMSVIQAWTHSCLQRRPTLTNVWGARIRQQELKVLLLKSPHLLQ